MNLKAIALSLMSAGLLGSAQAATSVKIATVSALSGPVSNMGLQLKNGTQLAVNEMRPAFARAGMTLSLVAYDDQADPATGTAAARRIVADKTVLGVVGPLTSGVAIPGSAVLAPSHVVAVTPTATSDKVTERGLANMNRVCARDDAQGSAGGSYLVNTLKAKKVYVLNDKAPYGQGLADQAEKAMKTAGANIVQSEGIDAQERDFTAIITKIQALKPDAVYFGGMYGQIGPFAKQLRDKGVAIPLFSGDGLDSPDMAKLAGSGATNIYFTTTAPDTEIVPAAQAEASSFKKTFGSEIQGFGILSYDAAKVLLQGILNAAKANGNKAPSRAQVEAAVRGGKFKGLTGDIDFDSKGDRVSAKMYVVTLKDGKRGSAGVIDVQRK